MRVTFGYFGVTFGITLAVLQRFVQASMRLLSLHVRPRPLPGALLHHAMVTGLGFRVQGLGFRVGLNDGTWSQVLRQRAREDVEPRIIVRMAATQALLGV